MGEKNRFELNLISLSKGRHELEYQINGDFFQERGNNDVLDCDITAYVDIDVKNDVYGIGVTCQGWIDVPCDRCLDPMRMEVDEDYDVTVRYGEDYDESDGVITIPEDQTTFDLSQLIADTVLLSIPIRHVHEAGECNPEMERYIDEHSSSEEEESDEEDI